MANKHDSRPFVDLQKDADEFRAKFEEDIEKCKSILDNKITALICDPDSLGISTGLKQNALVEFSKAKYDIYISMKSVMNEMEREWLKYISEMKKLFIDNVEVFLANTKLEVKLPSSGSLLSSGPKKSFGSKSNEVTGSLYPIISSITRSIPGFTQKKKSLDHEMENNEVDMDVSDVSSHHSHKGRFTDQMGNIYELTHASSRKPNRSTSRSRGADVFEERTNSSDESEEALETETNNNIYNVPSKARRGKQASKTQAQTKKLTQANSRMFDKSTSRFRGAAVSEERSNNSDESEEVMEMEANNNKYNAPSKARKGKQASQTQAYTKTASDERSNNSDESEEVMEMEANNNKYNAPSKARKGKQASKTQAYTKTASEERSNSSDESEEVMETEANSNKYNAPSKARKGKQASKTQAHTKIIEEEDDTGPEREEVLIKASRPRGRPSRRKTVNEIVIERDEEISNSQPSRPVTRRKTLLPNVKEIESSSGFIPGNHTSVRSKRKTIIGVSDLASEVPAKRLKNSNIQKINTTESEDCVTDLNLLENDSYSEWISLKSMDGKIPTSPGIYEVKVWRAKKTAYIGSCDSLRHKLTLHKLKQNSGHKHLDKFIERNYQDIQIRYEVVPSEKDAKVEVKNRVNNFVAQHKTTPAYN